MLDEPRLRLLDGMVVLWVVAWVALGVAVGLNVGRLTDLSHTVRADGVAVQTIGGTLNGLGSLPLVGPEVRRTAGQVEQAGASAVASGQSSASAIETLSVLLAIAVALLPSLPVAVLYLPMRMRRRREASALRDAVRRYGSHPGFQALLAQRALARVDYSRLAGEPALLDELVGRRDPENGARHRDRDGQPGRAVRPLAENELSRLGLDPALLGPEDVR